jgi:hypothetical protein
MLVPMRAAAKDEDLTVKESPFNRSYRRRIGYTKLAPVNAAAFKAEWERDHPSERLDWNAGRSARLRDLPFVDDHPKVYVTPGGKLDVLDGRHRITEAARRGGSIMVALPKKVVLPMSVAAKDAFRGEELGSEARKLKAKHDEMWSLPTRRAVGGQTAYASMAEPVTNLLREAEVLLRSTRISGKTTWLGKLDFGKKLVAQAKADAAKGDYESAAYRVDAALSSAHYVIDALRSLALRTGAKDFVSLIKDKDGCRMLKYTAKDNESKSMEWVSSRLARLRDDKGRCKVCGESTKSHSDAALADCYTKSLQPRWRAKDDRRARLHKALDRVMDARGGGVARDFVTNFDVEGKKFASAGEALTYAQRISAEELRSVAVKYGDDMSSTSVRSWWPKQRQTPPDTAALRHDAQREARELLKRGEGGRIAQAEARRILGK